MSGPGRCQCLMFLLSTVVYTLFLTIASLLLHRTPDVPVMALAGSLFVLSVGAGERFSWVRKSQLLWLALFHYTTRLHWVYPLYLMLAARQLARVDKLSRVIAGALLLVGVYTAVVVSYSTHTLYDYFMLATDLWVYVLVLLAARYILRIHAERRQLERVNQELAERDPLTNLYHLPEFHRRLETMLAEQKPCVVFLVDCINFKSINYERGFESGNEVLRQVGTYLQDNLSVDLLARFGSDKFAIAIQTDETDKVVREVRQVVGVRLEDDLSVEAIVGWVAAPTEVHQKDALISLLESRLFDVKRRAWRKREELMLQSEKLKVVGEMAAGMAHEIRNPLTTIQGLLQIAARSDYNVGPWYTLIMQEIQRMSALTGEFLQLSKPKDTHRESIPLQQLITKIVPLVEPAGLQLGHTIHVEAPVGPILVYIDVAKMSQVILNLVKNAFEAMEEPGDVILRIYESDSTGILEVQDTGKGIPAEEIHHLFLPFHTTKESGTGLGLYICQEILRTHGGMMEVESEVGQGALFRIRLPLLDPSPARPPAEMISDDILSPVQTRSYTE